MELKFDSKPLLSPYVVDFVFKESFLETHGFLMKVYLRSVQ